MATCVGALLIRGQEVLLGCRAAHKSYPGCWDILGGHVEPGESVEAALARELAEEVGVTPLEWRLLDSFRFQERDGWSDLLIYRIDSWEGDPFLANDEHVELRWLPFADACDLERLAAEEYRPILRSLKDAG
jgi:8-oxo-dGTP diphosphatase